MPKPAAILGVALTLLPASARADCGDAEPVWSRTIGRLEVRACKGANVVASGPYLFEGSVDGRLAWRVTAEYACSNGVPFCSVTVPMSHGDPMLAPVTGVGEPDRPDAIVFADLSLHLDYIRLHSVDPATVKADILDAEPRTRTAPARAPASC